MPALRVKLFGIASTAPRFVQLFPAGTVAQDQSPIVLCAEQHEELEQAQVCYPQ